MAGQSRKKRKEVDVNNQDLFSAEVADEQRKKDQAPDIEKLRFYFNDYYELIHNAPKINDDTLKKKLVTFNVSVSTLIQGVEINWS